MLYCTKYSIEPVVFNMDKIVEARYMEFNEKHFLRFMPEKLIGESHPLPTFPIIAVEYERQELVMQELNRIANITD